jgi:hypothetical protein
MRKLLLRRSKQSGSPEALKARGTSLAMSSGSSQRERGVSHVSSRSSQRERRVSQGATGSSQRERRVSQGATGSSQRERRVSHVSSGSSQRERGVSLVSTGSSLREGRASLAQGSPPERERRVSPMSTRSSQRERRVSHVSMGSSQREMRASDRRSSALARDRPAAPVAAPYFDRCAARPDGDDRCKLVGRDAREELQRVPRRLVVVGPAAAAARERTRGARRTSPSNSDSNVVHEMALSGETAVRGQSSGTRRPQASANPSEISAAAGLDPWQTRARAKARLPFRAPRRCTSSTLG